MMRGKKALYFGPLIVVLALIVLTTAFVNLGPAREIADNTGTTMLLGKQAVNLVKKYQNGEAAMLYTDLAAKYASVHAMLELSRRGGFGLTPECGQYKGKNVWYDKGQNCFPEFAKELSPVMNAAMDEYLRYYTVVPFPRKNYAISTKVEDDSLVIFGKAKRPLEFAIGRNVRPGVGVASRFVYGLGDIDIWPVESAKKTITSCFGYRGCVNHVDGDVDGECNMKSRCGCEIWENGYCTKYKPGRKGVCVPSEDCPEDGKKQPAECLGSYQHGGLDIRGIRGTSVLAIAGGVVKAYKKSLGMIRINHGNGISSEYLHMDKVFVNVGKSVDAGDRIGVVGGMGGGDPKKYTPHLHFNILDKNVEKNAIDIEGSKISIGGRVNPLCYLSKDQQFAIATDSMGCHQETCAADKDCLPSVGGALKFCQEYGVVS